MVWAFLMMAVTLAADSGATGRPDAGIPLWLMERAAPSRSSPGEYQLRRSGDGFVSGESTFEARIARDGVVTFHDRKAFFNHVGLLIKPIPPPEGTATLQGLLFGHTHKPRPEPAVPRSASPAERLDYSVLCPYDSTCYALPDTLIIGGVTGTMDLTDEIMRALGQDPYRVQKARFLAATFELRMKLAVEAHRENMHVSLDRLPAALADLWRDSRYSARERRRVMFELWREADPTPEGRRARIIIETFIGRELPCGSPDAYTSAELRALQGREPGQTRGEPPSSARREPSREGMETLPGVPHQTFSPYGSCGR